MRLIPLHHEDLTLFGHDISASDYSFFAKHKDAFRRMFREQGNMFWRRFMVSFKGYMMSYGIIENPLKKTNGGQYYQMVTEALNYLECQVMQTTTSRPKVFVEDSGILAQSRHLLGGIEAKPYKASKDPFYMKDTREVFRRVFGDPKDGPYLTLRVYIMYPLCMKMGATLCRLLRRWLDANDGTEDDIYWTPPSVDLFFSFGFHDDISRLRHDIDKLRKERGGHTVDIPRPLHLYPRDTLPSDLKPPETTTSNRADVIAAKKEEKRSKKKSKNKATVVEEEEPTNATITGLEMKRGADGTKFKVQFAEGGVSHVDVSRQGEEVKIKVTRSADGKEEEDARLQKALEDSVDTIKNKGKTKEEVEKEKKEKEEEEAYKRHREADAKAVEEAWKKTKEANKGKPRSKEAEYLRKKAKETFAEIDRHDGKKFGLDDPLIKLFREAVEDSEGEIEGEETTGEKLPDPNNPALVTTASSVSSSSSSKSPSLSSSSKKKQLRECANCKSVEAVRKTYKACQRCRERKVNKIKYYCSRTCQVKDWEAAHKKEHRDHDTVAVQQTDGDEDPDTAITQIVEHIKHLHNS